MAPRPVIGHIIEQNPDATSVSLVKQLAQVSLCPQARLNIEQVRSIITVVRGAGKEGRQPEDIDAQLYDVVQLLGHTFQGTTVESFRIGWMHPFLSTAWREAVDKDLVDHRIFCPGGHGVIGYVTGILRPPAGVDL